MQKSKLRIEAGMALSTGTPPSDTVQSRRLSEDIGAFVKAAITPTP
jgi:hypothetical protein